MFGKHRDGVFRKKGYAPTTTLERVPIQSKRDAVQRADRQQWRPAFWREGAAPQDRSPTDRPANIAAAGIVSIKQRTPNFSPRTRSVRELSPLLLSVR
jgi:hypothetical protein